MKFVISGYYGFANLGDEAILASLIEELRGRFPECEVVVLSAAPQETAREHGVRAIDRWDPRQILRELQGATALLSGGGGLIQDQTSRRSALYYLGVIALALMRRCPVMLIGQGIGPLRSRLLYRWAGRLLCRVDFAMVRDEPSMKLLSHWGLAGDRVVLGGDLALLLWPSWRALRAANARGTEGPRRLPMQQAEPIGRTYIVVCLKGELPEGVQAAMVRQLDHLSDELKIVFLALHPREDLSFMEEIAAQLARPALVLDTAGVSLKEVIECLAGAEAVVGMRLHALIFAMLAGRPFIAISAEPKIQSFLQQLEHSGGPEIPSFTLTQVENYTFELKEALSKISCEKALQQLEQAGEMLYMKTRTAVDLLMGRLAELAERGKGS